MIRVFNQYVSPKCLLLASLEGLLIVLGFLCGAKLRFWNSPTEFDSYIQLPGFAVQIAAVVIIFQLCFYYSDLYNLQSIRTKAVQFVYLGQSLGTASLILGTLYLLLPSLLPGRGVFVISAGCVAALVVLSRIALDRVWQAAAPMQNVLILGTKDLALTMAREVRKRDDLSLRVIGFYDLSSTPPETEAKLAGVHVYDRRTSIEEVVERHRVTRLLVAMEERRGLLPTRELVKLRVQGIRVEDAHSALSALTGRVRLETVHPSWFVFTDGFHRSRFTLIVKRAMDLAVSMLGLVLSFPIMVLVALAIKLDSKGPLIFRQTRVGHRGKCFETLKFRSMRVDAEKGTGAQWATQDDPRVTRVGRYLRRFRLDELPQFINVIRGDMSFVGPRPERPVFVEQLREVISYYDERHSVRPGLTGWAQVLYPYGASIEDAFRKLEYDLFYLKNMSILFDVAIILKTVRIVFSGRGGR
jgi:sugar transferase (PEP-CTERM system associated)